MGEEFDKASASYAAELSAAATQMAETTGAESPLMTHFTSSSPSGATPAIPMSAGNMLFPSAGLWAALLGNGLRIYETSRELARHATRETLYVRPGLPVFISSSSI